jgi:hypothetical protein
MAKGAQPTSKQRGKRRLRFVSNSIEERCNGLLEQLIASVAKQDPYFAFDVVLP